MSLARRSVSFSTMFRYLWYNAIKFSHHDSIIKVETSIKKSKLFISVKDTGIGIPKEALKLIWDRFYKSDLSRGRDKKGTGLGLSIVKEIINSAGAFEGGGGAADDAVDLEICPIQEHSCGVIVKEIINCHQEHINVISTEGEGSEFIFSLPLSQNMDEED